MEKSQNYYLMFESFPICSKYVSEFLAFRHLFIQINEHINEHINFRRCADKAHFPRIARCIVSRWLSQSWQLVCDTRTISLAMYIMYLNCIGWKRLNSHGQIMAVPLL